MIQNLIHVFLWWLTEKYPSRTRDISREGKKYLRRFYLTPRRLDKNGNETKKYLGFGIYLHYFYRGDEDKELHNHPWNVALSLILCGGYKEYRRINGSNKVVLTTKKPFTFSVIKSDTFHKVEMHEDRRPVWTLFITGKRIQEWGFWDKDNNEYVSYKDHVKQSEQGYKES